MYYSVPVQNLIITEGMFQNRQSTHNRKQKLNQTSSLFRPKPFLDERELLRLEGRLQKTALADEVKHLAVVPKKSPKTVIWSTKPIDNLGIEL